MLPTRTNLNDLILPEIANPKSIIKVLNVTQPEYDALSEDLKVLYAQDPDTLLYNIPDEIWVKQIRSGAICGVWPTTGGSSTAPLMDHYGVTGKVHLYDGQTGSEYHTALDRFFEEMGMEYPTDEVTDNADIFFIGHTEEESCRQYFKRYFEADHPDNKVRVINDTHCYQYQGYRYWEMPEHLKGILANVDGIIEITDENGEVNRGILECKTTRFNSSTAKLFKAGQVPYKYYIQLVVYMAVMNLPFAYICCKTGIDRDGFDYLYVERNLGVEKLVLSAIDQFFTDCENDTAPTINEESSDNILKFYRKMAGEIKDEAPLIELPESFGDIAIQIMDVNNELAEIAVAKKELEAKRIELLNQVLPYVGESTYATISIDEESYYSLKFRNTDKTLDTEKLMAEQPEIYNMYLQTKSTFNLALFKKEQKLLLPQYETFKYKKGGLTEAKKNFCEVEIKKKMAEKMPKKE